MQPRPLQPRKRRVIFPYRRKMASTNRDPDEDTLDEVLKDKGRIVELEDDEDDGSEISGPPFPGKGSKNPLKRVAKPTLDLPPWLQAATLGLFHEDLETATSESRKKTQADCLPFLTGDALKDYELNSHGLPHLRREQHASFLHGTLGSLPAAYVIIDASRPWLFYWAMSGLATLGEDVTEYKERLMDTVRPLQNSTGGFGGGYGQYSHCACSYATVLALTAVGGLEVVDRKAMWHWLGTVKQADGGFRMAVGAEEDIRGAYCAMTIITLLNLPLELPPDAPARKSGLTSFTDKLGEWVGKCQTYEGGISAAPTNEVHGAYAFCGLASLSILDAPHRSIPKYFDVHALASWLASMQTSPEGGFAGRTNKLVDACYSHWVGGCWSLLQAAVPGLEPGKDLWNREALIRYLLCCCQQPGKKGGMRDKPTARPDGYHTCYSLAGLSHAQNHYTYDRDGETVDKETGRLVAAFNWTAEKATKEELKAWKIDEQDVVNFVHPVLVIPFKAVERAREQFRVGGL
jgi:protein farnesyltransferase subunit beta